MAWTDPTTRATGDLITSAIWNTDIVDNLLAIGDSTPGLVDVDVFPTAISQTNWDAIGANASAVYNGVKEADGTQNAEINFDVVLGAGTWTIELMGATSSDRGIVTLQLSSDGGSTFTDVGDSPYDGSGSTLDYYAAAGAWNHRESITGITIAAAQRYRLKLKMATKNASSSGYKMWLQHVQLRRTA